MIALSLMQQQSASERLKGVSWSYQMQKPGGEVLTALLDTLTHDPNVNVRLATVDALRQFGDQPVVRRGLVDAMTRQESPLVQIALIDLAVDLREKESVGTLRQLTQDQKVNEAVRERAQRGLSELE
jgi:HEAT repeat protein